MKRAFISVLFFFFIFHFIIPAIYYWYNGFFNLYSDIDDPVALRKSFLINGISILLTAIIIWRLPQKNDKIPANIFNITPLYYFSIFFSLAYYISRGGYEGTVTGNMAGSLLSYIALFLNPSIIIMLLIFYQKKKYNVGAILLSFILFVTVTGRRSAIISVILMLLIYPAFENFSAYKSKLRKYILLFFIGSPLLFFAASRMRGIDLDILQNEILLKAIFGRLSMIELGAIPIHYKDLGGYNVELFNDKYGIIHQIKLIIDSLIPGNIFEYDVMPNQYYRAIFLGYSIDFVQDTYLSLNMTLPVYFYMYSNFVIAVLCTVITLVGYYYLWKRFSNNIFISIALIGQLYTLLYYFDFVMWFSQFLTTVLTILTINLFVFLRKEAFNYFKGYEKKAV
ncbi:hypothetical protein SAMN04488505_1011309 [Chitinophaga rupis]|uniref:Oligosaccharide repeat unit polymerase n=1 Tax=Chitinophaga rupis TaxID=573321 RepID=A0A1H7LQK4_9BACT|nr:hypothetical protein [Chitinophaga rupis]SEL01008.1 hypothetical protein SAMN04488505_1011309 [Chitinophaga rupis]